MKKTRKKSTWKDCSVTCQQFCSKSVVCLHSGFASWWAILVISLPDSLLQLVEHPSSPWENQEFHLYFFATSWLQARTFLPHFVYSFLRAFHKLSALFLHQSLDLNHPFLFLFFPLQPRLLASASSHFSNISSIKISISLSSMSTPLSFAWCFRLALNLSSSSLKCSCTFFFFTRNVTGRFRHSDDPWWHSIFLDLLSLLWRSKVLKLWLLSLGSKSYASVHSMIELEGKQNLIKNRLCPWIHLSGKFQNFRDKYFVDGLFVGLRILCVKMKTFLREESVFTFMRMACSFM